jgi:hypothetical protein
MTRTQKIVLAVGVVGIGLLVFLPLVGLAILVTSHKTPVEAPKPDKDAVPQADWVEIVPQSYWVIGPFGPGLNMAYEPEQQADPAKPCKTPAGEERDWVVRSIIPGAHCLDFRKALGLKNTDDTGAYALVYVHSAKEQPGELLLGSDDTITVWLNGAKVHDNPRLRMGVPDDDSVNVKWKQGCNTLLIKVGNGTGDHLFFAKLRSPSRLTPSTSKELE